MSENIVVDMELVEPGEASHSAEEVAALVPEKKENSSVCPTGVVTVSKSDMSTDYASTVKEKSLLLNSTGTSKENTTSRIEVTTTNPTTSVVVESTTNKEAATKPDSIPTYEKVTNMERRLVFTVASLGMFLSALDQIIVVICIPTLVRDLGGQQYLAWVMSAYLLTCASTMALYGKFSDIYGRYPMYMISLFLFLAGSMACGLAPGMWYLIGFRAVQGLGGGGLTSFCYILIGDIAKPSDRPKYISFVSAVYGIAVIVAPIVGGAFVAYVSWRWVFFINMPFGALAVVLSWFGLRKIENAQKQLKIDVLGSILVFLATVCVVLFATWGGVNYAWGSWQILLLIFGSLVLFALFVIQETRHSEPIINVRLFRMRNFAVVCLVVCFFGVSMFGGYPFIPIYFEYIQHDSAIVAGLKMIPVVIGMLIGSFGAGAYISKKGKFVWVVKIGLALLAIGEGLMSLMDEKISFKVDWIFLLIMGSGLGVSLVVLNAIVQNSVPPKDMASSIGALAFIRYLGGAIGVSVYGSLFNQEMERHLKHHLSRLDSESQALQSVFLYAMASALAGFIISFGVEPTAVLSKNPTAAPAPTTEK